MSPLSPWREELRRLIPRGFLRRDQGDWLFVSDYPRFGGEEETTRSLEAAGYAVQLESGLAHLDAGPEKYRALSASLADAPVLPQEGFLYSLGARLQRNGGETALDSLYLMRMTLKALDAGDLKALERLLPPAVAEAQRKHIPLPKAAGRMILSALNEAEMKRRGSTC
ncbi:MAG: hypothetical protein IK099_06590 [Clostridia bacterium]|nr:hypothetical protein [Clostridia bacterium]